MEPTDTNPDAVKLLSDGALREIEVRKVTDHHIESGAYIGCYILLSTAERDALCQTVRTLRGRYDSAVQDFAVEINALRDQLAQAQQRIALWFGPNTCSVCAGAPLASGRECVCGGKGTMQAEFEGLRQELFTIESQLAQVEQERERLRRVLATAAIPYEAMLLDSESRRWVAPAVWEAMENAVVAIRTEVKEQP